jgi:cytochrome c553
MSINLTPTAFFRVAGRLVLLALALAYAGPASAQSDDLVDLIAEACAPCHGDEGIAKSVDVPNLAGQHNVYLYNQLRAFRTGKRPHKEMRFMSRQMTDADMRAIADYYSSLPPR